MQIIRDRRGCRASFTWVWRQISPGCESDLLVPAVATSEKKESLETSIMVRSKAFCTPRDNHLSGCSVPSGEEIESVSRRPSTMSDLRRVCQRILHEFRTPAGKECRLCFLCVV